MKVGAMFGAILGMIGFAVVVSFLFAWPVMMLWNGCLIPAVSGLHEIGWLQAWGISVLSSFLIKTTMSK